MKSSLYLYSMKISIDEDICKKYEMDVSSVFAVLLIKTNPDYKSVISSLKEKDEIVNKMLEDYNPELVKKVACFDKIKIK